MATSSDFTFTTAASSTLLTGLVSYWKMDESSASATRVDSHTGGNNLVPDGGTNPEVDSIGKIGNAVKTTTGSFERMKAAHQANQNSAASMTISAWIKVHVLNGDGNGLHTVLCKSSTASDLAYFVGYRDHAPGPQWSFVVTPDGSTGTNCAVAGSAAVDQWYHLVAVYDHAATPKQLRLRVNDGTVGSQTTNFTGPVFASTAALYALVQIAGSAYFGDNSIDEVGLWNRALTLSEITALYNGGAGLSYPF